MYVEQKLEADIHVLCFFYGIQTGKQLHGPTDENWFSPPKDIYGIEDISIISQIHCLPRSIRS